LCADRHHQVRGPDEQRQLAGHQLDLRLAPGEGCETGCVRGHRLGRDAIVGDLGEEVAVLPVQAVGPAVGPDDHDRRQPFVADDAGDHFAQRQGRDPHGPTRWQDDLQPATARRQLQVPAGIVTTDAAAQRHPGRREGEVRGVEVRRHELVVDHRHGLHAGHRAEAGKVCGLVEGVLVLDLGVVAGHAPFSTGPR
jgi:hypothetical protein